MSFFSDEILMQYADGELGESTRHALEMAMRQDPILAARVKQHQILRSNVFAAFAPTVDEAVPERLQAAARSGKVVQLNSARGARLMPLPQQEPPPRKWGVREWGAIAATLVAGIVAGGAGMHAMRDQSQLAIASSGGALVAQGALEDALSNKLAGARGPVALGVSFLSRDGVYCRSFRLAAAAGLACRSGDAWDIPVLVHTEAGTLSGNAMPPVVFQAVEARMDGRPLDRAGERAALQAGWLPAVLR